LPRLNPDSRAGPVRPHFCLLINPFYPKDPHASFGKHVLTPTLALTSIAAATPSHWDVKYLDENLLQGPPPHEPFPQVVGISVHLTFARRAFALAEWYRRRGAVVVLGGLHVLSCPDECRPHADALAIGEGVQCWGQILADVDAGELRPSMPEPRVYRGTYTSVPYRSDPAPRRDLLPKDSFLTTSSLIATRGCHNRCGFCYLATDGLQQPYQTRDVEQVVSEFLADGQPYAVFTRTGNRTPSSPTTTSGANRITFGNCAARCGRSSGSGRRPCRSTSPTTSRPCAKWRWRGARACSSASSR
jgi:hypothetical protein